MPQGQLWPFLCMHNSKLGKKIAEANLAKMWSIRQKFTSKRKQAMYNFANKVDD